LGFNGMNQERWLIKDKKWLNERKTQWSEVHLRLLHSEKFTKKQLKAYESFFLRGRTPKWNVLFDNDPIPLIFRLWFDPDQSEQNWSEIRDLVLNYPEPIVIRESLRETFDIFHEADNGVIYSGLFKTPNSFMNGLEKKMFSFLYGSPDSSEYIKFNGEEFYVIRLFHGYYYSDNYRWLDSKNLCNSFKISQYKLEHWYYKLTDEYCDKLEKLTPSGDSSLANVRLYLEKVQEYKYLSEGYIDEVRAGYCRNVRDILDNRVLPEKMQQWWLDAKSKVDSEMVATDE